MSSLQYLLNFAPTLDNLNVFKKITKLPKYISTHLMLFHAIKQHLVILSTSFLQFHSLTLLFLLKLRIFTK